MHPNCMLELGQGWGEGELVREREIVVASCFLISEITLHGMNAACQPLVDYIIFASQRRSNASSVQLLSE